MQKTKNINDDLVFSYIDNKLNGDFRIIAVGREKCKSDKEMQGPVVKNRFIIHLCTDGEGSYNLEGTKYRIQKGEMFLIPPNRTISYVQNPQNPWSYYWFEYTGELASRISELANFSFENPTYRSSSFQELEKIMSSCISSSANKNDELLTISYIYRFFSTIINERKNSTRTAYSKTDELIHKITSYIADYYNHINLSLNEISAHFSFSPSYISKIFKEKIGTPITRYITEFRIQKAVELLKLENLTIKSIALSVGYSDPLYFTREFRRCLKNSPTNYRKEVLSRRDRSAKKTSSK